MIDWGKGFSASYYVYTIDPHSWADVERFEITGGSISRTDENLRQSADINTVNHEFSGEKWVRIYMIAKQGGDVSRVALFTGLATSPSKQINGRRIDNTLQCYSVLKPLEDILLKRGWYAAKSMPVVSIIDQLIEPLSAPHTVASSDILLDTYLIAENNETHMSMLEVLLATINWRIRIEGDGHIFIGPYDDNEVAMFDGRANDVIEPSLSVEKDWYNCPNILRVVSGDREYIEYDESDSPYSIKNRGREVWAEDTATELVNGESLEYYAKRKLAELQEVAVKISYSRPYNPSVNVSDVVRINYPGTGNDELSGLFYVKSQSIQLGYDAKTNEEVVQL